MRVLFLTDSLSDLDGVGRYAVRLIEAVATSEANAGVDDGAGHRADDIGQPLLAASGTARSVAAVPPECNSLGCP